MKSASIVLIIFLVTMTNMKCYDYNIISENDYYSNQNFFSPQNSNKNSLLPSLNDDLNKLSAKFRIHLIQNNDNNYYSNKNDYMSSIKDDLKKFYTINRYEVKKNDNNLNNYNGKNENQYQNKENSIDESSYIKQLTRRLIDYIAINRISISFIFNI
jgi:hypothetical protein